MRLQHLSAIPHPLGNRIDLTWVQPEPIQYPGMRVVRRQGTHPTSPQPGRPGEGVVVADTNPSAPGQHQVHVGEDGLYRAIDTDLQGETIYYYTLFPYAGDPPIYTIDRHNRIAAMAIAPYDMVRQLVELLPTIYLRYDTERPKPDATVAESVRHQGQLRRFLELPASQLDLLYSFARAMLDLHHLDKVDGRLLPLLAQWIGWPTDFRLDVAAQRQEIRNAPDVYQTIGIIPTLEATVKRILGLESRTKEFVHNVFRSNQPERLNLWIRQQDHDGAWSEPTTPLSLDFAYAGRPTAAPDEAGTLWLFYHTLKKGQWDIWYKTYRDDHGWTPSQPLNQRRLTTDTHPTAVVQGSTLWVFWSGYDQAQQTWQIHYRTRSNGQWSPIAPLPFADATTLRRHPWAVVDHDGGLWLFWRELVGTRWQLQYNRHDGTSWALSASASFPADSGLDPRVESPPFVLYHPTATTQRLWVFWARKDANALPGQTRWRIVYRVKASLDPTAADWSAIRALPSDTPDAHDREPVALVDDDGNITLFWSSSRQGSRAIWHGVLNATTHTWGTFAPISPNPYAQRDPLAVASASGPFLIYRSNASLLYGSTRYAATQTVDSRYAGCTTVDTRDHAKIALQGQFDDFQAYTYDAGSPGARTPLDWYARDTVGIYLPAGATEAVSSGHSQQPFADVLREFLPLQARAVFIVEPTSTLRA